MQQTVWINSQVPQPATTGLVGEVSGMYTAWPNGSECVLKLWHDSHGFVHGSFSTEEETLEFRGGYSPKILTLQGYVFEPFGMLPVASLSAEQTVQGLRVQMGLLESDSPYQPRQSERLHFSRVLELNQVVEDFQQKLIGSFC